MTTRVIHRVVIASLGLGVHHSGSRTRGSMPVSRPSQELADPSPAPASCSAGGLSRTGGRLVAEGLALVPGAMNRDVAVQSGDVISQQRPRRAQRPSYEGPRRSASPATLRNGPGEAAVNEYGLSVRAIRQMSAAILIWEARSCGILGDNEWIAIGVGSDKTEQTAENDRPRKRQRRNQNDRAGRADDDGQRAQRVPRSAEGFLGQKPIEAEERLRASSRKGSRRGTATQVQKKTPLSAGMRQRGRTEKRRTSGEVNGSAKRVRGNVEKNTRS